MTMPRGLQQLTQDPNPFTPGPLLSTDEQEQLLTAALHGRPLRLATTEGHIDLSAFGTLSRYRAVRLNVVKHARLVDVRGTVRVAVRIDSVLGLLKDDRGRLHRLSDDHFENQRLIAEAVRTSPATVTPTRLELVARTHVSRQEAQDALQGRAA